jgi:hypothetical protein
VWTGLAELFGLIVDRDAPVAFRAYDGSQVAHEAAVYRFRG